eukprot:51626-Rhodomonas_salina.1
MKLCGRRRLPGQKYGSSTAAEDLPGQPCDWPGCLCADTRAAWSIESAIALDVHTSALAIAAP